MPRHPSHLLELAARGAKHRYDELQAERASLIRQFPSLRNGAAAAVKRGREAVRAVAGNSDSAPRKRTMSAAARRRISLAQKKRWATQKAATK
jgi:hypothetical protein